MKKDVVRGQVEAERLFVADEMDLVAALRELLPELRRKDAAPTDRRIADDRDPKRLAQNRLADPGRSVSP